MILPEADIEVEGVGIDLADTEDELRCRREGVG
jgi:hypothetical protein